MFFLMMTLTLQYLYVNHLGTSLLKHDPKATNKTSSRPVPDNRFGLMYGYLVKTLACNIII